MKRFVALAAVVLCLTLAGCVVAVPTELPDIEIPEMVTTTFYYPLETTYEDTAAGVITLTEYAWTKADGVLRLDRPVTATVYVNGQETESYEVLFDDRGNFIRISETDITNTYDDEGRLLECVYSEKGEVIKSVTREYDEKGLLSVETVRDSEGKIISRDTYVYEGEYNSYGTAEHYDADGRCTGSCQYAYNRGGVPNTRQHYDAEGNMVSLERWLYFTHSITEPVATETE